MRFGGIKFQPEQPICSLEGLTEIRVISNKKENGWEQNKKNRCTNFWNHPQPQGISMLKRYSKGDISSFYQKV